eukprot:Pgem_evm1s9542
MTDSEKAMNLEKEKNDCNSNSNSSGSSISMSESSTKRLKVDDDNKEQEKAKPTTESEQASKNHNNANNNNNNNNNKGEDDNDESEKRKIAVNLKADIAKIGDNLKPPITQGLSKKLTKQQEKKIRMVRGQFGSLMADKNHQAVIDKFNDLKNTEMPWLEHDIEVICMVLHTMSKSGKAE